MKHPLVQILVVVAITQMGTLRTEVGKGSMSTVLVHGLVVPKLGVKSLFKGDILLFQRNCLTGERESG